MHRLRKTEWLSGLVLLGSVLVFAALLVRVGWMQTHTTHATMRELRSEHTIVTHLMARRASIYTSDSTLIAGSVRVYSFYADPGYIFDPNGTLNALPPNEVPKAERVMARAIAPLLGQSAAQLTAMLRAHLYYPNRQLRRFLWLKRGVKQNFYRRVEAVHHQLEHRAVEALRHHHPNLADIYYHALDGVGFKRSTRRVYPLGSFAGQVIGFANSNRGLQGLEGQLNSLLVGRNGRVVYAKEATERALWIEKRGYKPPSNGMKVWLTLNTTMQGVADRALDKACQYFKAHSGAAVLMDPYNGDILAMANYPPLNPNDYQATPEKFWRNRAVTDPYEPGSCFKPFNVGWALQHHIITLQTVFNCHHGRWRDPTGRLIKDVDGHGFLTVENILVYSSNIGMTHVGWRMGIPRLYAGVHAFGFGQMTGSILPGESPGMVRPEDQWTKGTETSASFGYGVGVTTLQLARAFCVFANGGYLPTPQIVKAVEVKPGKIESWSEIAGPQPMKKLLSRHVCREMIGAMEQVMERGTGQYCLSPVYQLYGKTGTANLAIAGQDGYHKHEYNATFVEGGPVPHPRLICVVSVNQPDPKLGHFGGTVAGPECTKIMVKALQYLQVPPDQSPATDPWWGKEKQLWAESGLSH